MLARDFGPRALAEVCRMTARHIDMRGDAWTYSPPQHKNTWRRHERDLAVTTKPPLDDRDA